MSFDSLYVLLVASVFVLFFVVGKLIEVMHLKNLEEREKALKDMILTTGKSLPDGLVARSSWLCQGSVVLGADHFKVLVARLKAMLGGRLGSMESVLERARREAVLRMAESAKESGGRIVINIRLETSTIGRGQEDRNAMVMAEVLAYGTAVDAKEAF